MMIVFTEIGMYPLVNSRGFHMFNFLCPTMVGVRVDKMFPAAQVLEKAAYDTNLFESFYLNWLMRDKEAFMDFMTMMMGDYYSENAIVFTDLNYEIVETIIDCLIKFIRERYGLKAIIAYDIEDIICNYDTIVTKEKALQFIEDKEWYTKNSVDPDVLANNIDKVEDMNAESL